MIFSASGSKMSKKYSCMCEKCVCINISNLDKDSSSMSFFENVESKACHVT